MIEIKKYQGLGNDFIVVDSRSQNIPDNLLVGTPSTIKKICQRGFGVGADGLIIARESEGTGDIRMQIFNSNGSEAEMCGNGIRCLIKY